MDMEKAQALIEACRQRTISLLRDYYMDILKYDLPPKLRSFVKQNPPSFHKVYLDPRDSAKEKKLVHLQAYCDQLDRTAIDTLKPWVQYCQTVLEGEAGSLFLQLRTVLPKDCYDKLTEWETDLNLSLSYIPLQIADPYLVLIAIHLHKLHHQSITDAFQCVFEAMEKQLALHFPQVEAIVNDRFRRLQEKLLRVCGQEK